MPWCLTFRNDQIFGLMEGKTRPDLSKAVYTGKVLFGALNALQTSATYTTPDTDWIKSAAAVCKPFAGVRGNVDWRSGSFPDHGCREFAAINAYADNE